MLSTSETKSGNSIIQPLHFLNCNVSFAGLLHNLPFRVDPVSASQTQNCHFMSQVATFWMFCFV